MCQPPIISPSDNLSGNPVLRFDMVARHVSLLEIIAAGLLAQNKGFVYHLAENKPSGNPKLHKPLMGDSHVSFVLCHWREVRCEHTV